MIHRQIVRVKTLGSREEGTLRPDISLEKGFNMVVLDYEQDTAIVEIWCSDHELVDSPKTRADLDNFTKGMEKLSYHPKSPKKLAKISIKKSHPNIKIIDSVNPKIVKFKGKKINYKRIEEEEVVIDEG